MYFICLDLVFLIVEFVSPEKQFQPFFLSDYKKQQTIQQ